MVTGLTGRPSVSCRRHRPRGDPLLSFGFGEQSYGVRFCFQHSSTHVQLQELLLRAMAGDLGPPCGDAR